MQIVVCIASQTVYFIKISDFYSEYKWKYINTLQICNVCIFSCSW
jgi:hypothetical protein